MKYLYIKLHLQPWFIVLQCAKIQQNKTGKQPILFWRPVNFYFNVF